MNCSPTIRQSCVLVRHFTWTVLTALVLLQLSGCMTISKTFLSQAEITHHLDNLVVMQTSRSLTKRDKMLNFEICKTFYKNYQDVFDVLFVISNVPRQEFVDGEVGYYGVMAVVRNDELGTGVEIFDHGGWFYSQSTLRGVMHLPAKDLLGGGPSLHEFMHLWVLDREVIPTVIEGHWGFSSVNGQLGGFDINKLVELGDDKYSAGRFGINANFGNSLPYAPLELYLAGWIPSDEVMDTWVAEDGEFLFEADPDNPDVKKQQTGPEGFPIFRATQVSTWNIEEIVEALGERVPSFEDSQKTFRVAAVLVGSEEFPVTENDIEFVRAQVEQFSRKSSLRESLGLNTYNFWDATGGRASIEADGLREFRLHTEKIEP